MDENKMIRPMDFVRLTNIDELNVIKDTKNHIGLVKEVSRDGSVQKAAKDGGITKISHIDQKSTSVLGLFAKYTITVYGD